MEQADFVIPTRFKVKIANTLSWPLGAEKLTVGLSDVPQLSALEVWFTDTRQSGSSWSWQPLIEAAYSKRSNSVFTNPTNRERLQTRYWSLRVSPVPRTARGLLQARIIEQLPKISEWLKEHSKRQAMGQISIRMIWNKEKDTVYCSETTSKEQEIT